MELAFVVYLISILESVSNFLGALCGISAFIAFVIVLVGVIVMEGQFILKKTVISLIILALLCGTVKALLPSEKQAYAIAAAYGAQQVYQSEEAKQIGNKVLKAINNKLDSMAEPEKKETQK